jgi:hypothetical protein
VGCQEMAVIGEGEELSRSAGVRERLVCMREGEGPPHAARDRWDVVEIWGIVGAAKRCRRVA